MEELVGSIVVALLMLVLLWGGVRQARRNLNESKTDRSAELVERDRAKAQRRRSRP